VFFGTFYLLPIFIESILKIIALWANKIIPE
jgi:hypothetical protein